MRLLSRNGENFRALKVFLAAGVPAISSQGGWDQHLSQPGCVIHLPCSRQCLITSNGERSSLWFEPPRSSLLIWVTRRIELLSSVHDRRCALRYATIYSFNVEIVCLPVETLRGLVFLVARWACMGRNALRSPRPGLLLLNFVLCPWSAIILDQLFCQSCQASY